MNIYNEIDINPFYYRTFECRTDIENMIQDCICSFINYGYYNYLDYQYGNKQQFPAFRISPNEANHCDLVSLYKEFVITFNTKLNRIKLRFADKLSPSKIQIDFECEYNYSKDDIGHIQMLNFKDTKLVMLVNILEENIDWLRNTISSSMPFNEYFPIGSTWKHFKGYELTVIAVAKHTETGETLVVYECRNPKDENYVPSIWARPMSMFFEKIDENKYPEHKGEYRITRMGDKL